MKALTHGKNVLLAFVLAAFLIVGFMLTGCGGETTYADGTYTAQSGVYEDEEDGNGNGYGVVTITITDGEISDCEFLAYETDGTLKDEDYGKVSSGIANEDYYNKAQKAVAACSEYAAQLVEVGEVDGVDLISGATIMYSEFQDAAYAALDEAAE